MYLKSFYDIDTGDLCIVMEYCEYGTLTNMVQRVQRQGADGATQSLFNGHNICGMIYSIARALCYVHQKGIIHRDIKPDNILCEADQTVFRLKLADFGIGKSYDSCFLRFIVIPVRVGSSGAHCSIVNLSSPGTSCKLATNQQNSADPSGSQRIPADSSGFQRIPADPSTPSFIARL